MEPSQPQTRTGLRDRPGAPMPVPAYLYRTDFCPEFRTVGLKVDSLLKSLERERDLRAEVEREQEKIRSGALREKDKLRFERLDAETRFFLGNAQAPLMTSESNNWQPDRDLHAWSPEPTHMKKAHDEIISQEMDTWIREHDEERRQRATTLKDMKELVQTLTTQLNEQMEIFNQATENQAKLEAENQRLQQLLDTRAKEYQERRQSQEERHSATLQRLINEHTAAMSEQMDVYEKELVGLRVAHEREVAGKPEYEEELDRLLESIKSLGRKHWRNSEGSQSQDEDC